MRVRSTARLLAAGWPVLVMLGGCREDAASASLNRDIGEPGRVLLPTDPVWVTADIAKGQAEWHPFRKPDETPPDAGAETVDGLAEAGDASGIDAELREFLTTYNSVVDANPEELISYFVAEQQEVLKPLLDAAGALAALNGEVDAALEAGVADDADRAAALRTALRASTPIYLTAASFSGVSENGATVQLAPGSMFDRCEITLVDGEWYLQAPSEDAPSIARAAIDAAAAARRGWLETLQAEERDLAGVAEQIEAAAEAVRSADPGEPAEPEPSPADAEPSDEPAPDDEPDGD